MKKFTVKVLSVRLRSQSDHWGPVYDKIKWFYITSLEKAEVASGSP